MVIEKLNLGAHGRKIVYAVCADAQETGDNEYRAKEAIKKASAPTVESKRTRKAE